MAALDGANRGAFIAKLIDCPNIREQLFDRMLSGAMPEGATASAVASVAITTSSPNLMQRALDAGFIPEVRNVERPL